VIHTRPEASSRTETLVACLAILIPRPGISLNLP